MKTDAKYLIYRFGVNYREKVGELYPPSWGRDTKIFNDLLNLYSVDKLEALLDIYFEQKAKIYSLPYFKVALGELLQLQEKDRQSRPRVMSDEDDWRFT